MLTTEPQTKIQRTVFGIGCWLPMLRVTPRNPSEENLYGAAGLAPWAALQAGVERPRYHAALVDAMLGLERNAAVDSPPDIVLAVLMGQLHHRHR